MTPDQAADQLDAALADCRALLPEPALAAMLAPPDRTADDGSGSEPPTNATTGPRWEPLVMVPIPGLAQIAAIAKPPLQIVRAVLAVIKALAEALAAILIGLLDPLRMIVLAAYEALRNLVQDLIHAGGYLYVDPTSWNEVLPSAEELGIPLRPEEPFLAGKGGKPPPPHIDGWTKWATRFGASFDDPGDTQRPILSDGASVNALFVVWAAPSFEALAQLLYQLGSLLNVDAWKIAFASYRPGPDPSLAAARGQRMSPDWRSVTLEDLIPPISELTALPKLLLELLKAGDGLAGLLRALAGAIEQKVQVIQKLIDTIDAILALLDALSMTGLKALFVTTTQGVGGLKQAFLTAANRPEGAHVAGLCLLAAGPGMGDATLLYELFGQGRAVDMLEGAYDQTVEKAEAAWEKAGGEAAVDALGTTAEQAANDFVNAVANAPEGVVGSIVDVGESVVDTVAAAPAAVAGKLGEVAEVQGSGAIAEGKRRADQLARKADGSLAAGYGAQTKKGGGNA